jgi:ABC-type uncharacterized transport system substrate-binding protein
VDTGGRISKPPLGGGDSRATVCALPRGVLNGEKPVNLPVSFPTKFELTVNVRTAKALNLTIPPMVLPRADEVLE